MISGAFGTQSDLSDGNSDGDTSSPCRSEAEPDCEIQRKYRRVPCARCTNCYAKTEYCVCGGEAVCQRCDHAESCCTCPAVLCWFRTHPVHARAMGRDRRQDKFAYVDPRIRDLEWDDALARNLDEASPRKLQDSRLRDYARLKCYNARHERLRKLIEDRQGAKRLCPLHRGHEHRIRCDRHQLQCSVDKSRPNDSGRRIADEWRRLRWSTSKYHQHACYLMESFPELVTHHADSLTWKMHEYSPPPRVGGGYKLDKRPP